MLGYAREDMIGRTITAFIPTEDWVDQEERMKKRRQGISETYERRFIHKDGRLLWMLVSAAPVLDDRGQLSGSVTMCTDITARIQHEQQIQILLREVNHRAKNLLAVVQAIAWQMADIRPQDFVERFTDRLHALAACQDLLVASWWGGVDVKALIESQLGHIADGIGTRIVLDGPPVKLSASASQAIGMAVHELSTNASKYGALSVATGRIALNWWIERGGTDAEDSFVLSWVERGGPPVRPPDHRGFGYTVLAVAPRLQLDACTELNYSPQGLCWHLRCVASKVLAS